MKNHRPVVEVLEEVVGATEEVQLYGGDVEELTAIMDTLVQQVETEIIPVGVSPEGRPAKQVIMDVNKVGG